MTFEDKIIDEKLQKDINRKAAKWSVLSSGKIDKYESFTGEESRADHRSKQKQTKSIENQFERKIKAIQKHEEQLNKSNTFV